MVGTQARGSTGIVVAAFLALAATYFTMASSDFVLAATQVDLAYTIDAANSLSFAPSAGSLVIVFLVGSLADRWGPRPMLLGASAIFAVGAALVCLAPSLIWVVAGRMLDGIGGVAMTIVGLSVINTTFTESKERARIFGLYAALTPALFIISPPLAAFLVDLVGWRGAVVPWILIGAATFIATLRYVPGGHESKTGELLTPLCAGLVLAGLALGAMNVNANASVALICFAIAVVALIALVILLRRLPKPTLNVRWIRQPGVVLLIIILFLAVAPNLFFYTNLLLQYRYTMPRVGIALLLIVPQAFAVLGALLSGRVSARIGPARAALIGLAASAVSCLGVFLVRADSPVWVPVLTLSVHALPFSFVVGPLTNVLLGRAPTEASGTASAVRKATTNLASVFGGLILATLAFNAFKSKLSDILANAGLATDVAERIAQEVRDGAVVDRMATTLSDPIAREALLNKGAGLLEAQSWAFDVYGVMSAGVLLVATLLMALYLRRAPRATETEPA